jgi:hypothetical protein
MDFPLAPYFAEGNQALLQHFTQHFHHGITSTNPGFYEPQRGETSVETNSGK